MGRMLLAGLLGGGLLAGCVSETDHSLREGSGSGSEAPAAATGEAAAGEPAAVTTLAVTLGDSTLTVSAPSASAGTLTMQIRNQGGAAHALLVRGGAEQWESGPLAAGDSVNMSIALPAGSYQLLCPMIEGGAHATRGETATLTVR